MSYVLDALRRADAERHRGDVPHLHAQPLHAAPGAAGSAPTTRRWWPLAALAGVAAAALALMVFGEWGPAPPPAWTEAPPPSTEPPPPAPVAAAPAPVPRPVPPMPVSRQPPPTPPAAEPAVAAAPAARPPKLQDLPESLRRQLPPLAFGGATYSPAPASRMLIINGQIFREGDEPAPGLVLEQIALRSAQMRFRGQRFEVAY